MTVVHVTGGAMAKVARWLAALAALIALVATANPARATLAADGRYDVAVLNATTPDASFWQEQNLASVMGTAPGNQPFRLSYVDVGALTQAGLAAFDVVVVGSNERSWVTATASAALRDFVSGGGVLIIAPGTFGDFALLSDPLMSQFGTTYSLFWKQGDAIDTGCNGGAVWPAKSLAGPVPLDPAVLTPNPVDVVFTDCDHILLSSAGSAFRVIAQTLQRTQSNPAVRVLRTELMTATLGSGRIFASATTFSHNTLQDKQLAENMVLTAAVPVGGPPPDTTAPTVTLSSLPRFYSRSRITVSGTVQDAGGVAQVDVAVNGVVVASPTPTATGGVSASVTLAPGANTIVLRATDAAGNAATQTGSVFYDDQAPVVHVTSTTTLTNDPSYLLRGIATDSGTGIFSVRLEVNTVSVAAPTPSSDGSVSGYVTLVEGDNLLEIEANDYGGGYAADSIVVTLDTTPPSARLLSVPLLTNSPALTIVGSASDAHGVGRVQVSVNGVVVGTPTPDAGGVVSVPATLAPGLNTVVLQVTDAAGNVTADRVDVTLDAAAPSVTVITPLPGQTFGTSSVPLTINVDDASPTTVDVDGQTATFDTGSGRFSTFVTFGGNTVPAEGPNTIVITARDAAGNVSTTSVDVILDFSRPIVTTDVADGALLAAQPGDQLLVTLHVDDLGATTVSAGGGTYALSAGGGVVQFAAPLVAGQNIIPITVTDAAGNTTSIARMVVYDVTPPAPTLVGPHAGTFVRGSVDVAASAIDDLTGVARATASIDGAAAVEMTAAGGTWLTTIDTTTLADGPHTATLAFFDGVGNRATLTTTFVVDNTPPSVAITAPAVGAFLAGTISINATASDAVSGASSIAIAVNGVVIKRCASAASCAGTFDTRTLADGPLLITATATDGAGNDATPATVTAAALNNAPSKFLVSPIQGAIVKESMLVQVNVTAPYFASVECFVDGVSLGVSSSRTFQATVPLLTTKLDGPVNVRCTAIDAAGNKGTESATVTLKNWNSTLSPRYLALLQSQTSNILGFSVDGPDPSMRQLIPWTDLGLQLAIPGGPPVPLLVSTQPGIFPHAPRLNVVFYFDRNAVMASIRAGIAAGSIDPTQSIPISLVSRGRVLGTDLMRVPTAPTPI